MDVKRKRKRLFGSCILLLMTALTVCTITYALVAEVRGSYGHALVIRKQFAEGTPADVLAKAQKENYTFLIEGTQGDGTKISETITLPRVDEAGETVWESEAYDFGRAKVTVTEITDNILIEVDGKYYNMSDSSTDAIIPVDSRKHEVELKNNSTLTISRKSPNPWEYDDIGEGTALWYLVTSRQEDDHHASAFTPMNEVFSLEAGAEKEFSGLSAGIYTIEQIAAPDGYQLQLGTRTEEVAAGETGHFHINGTPGSLTLTADNDENGSTLHYYRIERTEAEDDSEFVTRTVSVAPGGTYKLDDLPKGGYTVTEYSAGATAFSVKTTQTDVETLDGLAEISEDGGFSAYYLNDINTTYFKLDSFGPLYDANGKMINNASITYSFDYGWGNESGGIIPALVGDNLFAYGRYTLSNSPARYPKSPIIAFRVYNLSNDTAKYIGVKWTEYTEKEVTKTFDSANVQYTSDITVDDRGWMQITAPEVKADSAPNIAYYYTILDSGNKLLAFTGNATDREGTSIKLSAGQRIKLTGLKAGSYKITETVEWDRLGFTMDVSGSPFGTTEQDKTIHVTVGGERDITISKPALADPPSEMTGTLEYTFAVWGKNFDEKVTIEAGASKTLTLPEEGTYTIVPQDDTLKPYYLSYTDSGAVYGMASGSGTITFTNSFSQGSCGYRFVHEYYVKDGDRYTYEGSSQITTRLGRPAGEFYQAGDINKATSYEGRQYIHFNESYGAIVSTEGTYNNGTYDGGIATGSDSNGTLLNYSPYSPDDLKDRIYVKEDASEIIILRYYRERQPEGKYNVIHVYYFRDENGDTWEGTSGILTQTGELGFKYTGDKINKVYDFQPEGADRSYEYTWDLRPQYGVVERTGGNPDDPDPSTNDDEYAGEGWLYRPNNAWDSVEGTEEGSQIIILRYYRGLEDKEDPGQNEEVKEGRYNIVHEYYFRQPSESLSSGESGSTAGRSAQAQSETNDNLEIGEIEEGAASTFAGTLNRNDGYVYTFEGKSAMKSRTADLNSTHTAAEGDRELSYGQHKYTYIEVGYGTKTGDGSYSCNPDRQWAASTEDGNEVIILRYYREETPTDPGTTPGGPSNPPEDPDNPPEDPNNPPEDPENPPENPDNPPEDPENPPENPDHPPEDPENPPEDPDHPTEDPENPPEDPDRPTEDPENPPEDPDRPTEDPENPPEDPDNPTEGSENPPPDPSYPTELPDPNDPDSPDEITILVDGVPLTYVKIWDPEAEEWIYVPEDEVPLMNHEIPSTGDSSALWTALATVSLCGLFMLSFPPRKLTGKRIK